MHADHQSHKCPHTTVLLVRSLLWIILGKLMGVQAFERSTLFPTVMAKRVVEIPVSVHVETSNPVNTFSGAVWAWSMVSIDDI
eukprot:COSAG01_NODE_53247_length_340_cov_1.655602_1_plen_82_part_01